MRRSNKKLIVLVFSILISFMAVQAFGKGPHGPKGPSFVPQFRIVEGCVMLIHDDTVDGITLCTANIDDCSQCDVDYQETILGIGPPHYWDQPCIANIDENGDIIIDAETGFFCISNDLSYVPVPDIGDFVKIKAYDVLLPDEVSFTDEDDVVTTIAFWVQTEELEADQVLLLRDPVTLKCLWSGLGNKK